MIAPARTLVALLLLLVPAVAQQDEDALPLHPSPGALKAPASAVPS